MNKKNNLTCLFDSLVGSHPLQQSIFFHMYSRRLLRGHLQTGVQ